MMASGNGTPQQCADNLLKTARFSVPYERIKGIDGGLVDTPAASAGAGLAADAEWLLETYEPRVEVNNIEVTNTDEPDDFGLVADLSINTEEDE
ncbi:MAG: hypothetical protein ACTTK0_02615 [Stomatobaculum sp.]